jgi:DNA invertase Pin-like site-specific DNA recombinase
MKIGYARVSTNDQNLDLQISALNRAGCERLFTDQGVPGSQFSRPGLDSLLSILKTGDMLMVWRLDRLGRSLIHLVELVHRLGEGGIEFRSLTENIDTSSSGGRLVFHMMAALAEFERSLISERTRAGMAAAQAQGRHIGRPWSLSPEQCAEARAAVERENLPLEKVARNYNVHPRTLARLLRQRLDARQVL